jgi:L-ascorbate metabolism protein UlaG (beta-lactamase superfamily)
MRLTWYGHAAFRVETSRGAVIMDPYNCPQAGGYSAVDDSAHVVTISHVNPKYHSDTSSIHRPYQLLNGLDFLDKEKTAAGLGFKSCLVYEDAEGNGPNAMIRIDADRVSLAHMGDCGHALNLKQLEFLEGVDVLLAPAGGPPTIALPDLIHAIQKLRPHIVIPMHYKTPKINLPIRPVEEILPLAAEAGIAVKYTNSHTVQLPPPRWPPETQIWIMNYAR